MFSQTVVQKTSGEIVVTLPTRWTWAPTNRGSCRQGSRLNEAFGPKLTSTQIFLLKLSVSGADNFWSVRWLHQHCMEECTLTASEWCHSWWAWWSQSFQDMRSDPSAHLRKGSHTSTRRPEDARFRFLLVLAFIAFGLLYLLARLPSARRSKIKNPEYIHWVKNDATHHFVQVL